jgi:xylulokinase
VTQSAVVGIDIGTRSTKAVLVDSTTGSLIAQTSVEHSVELPGGGRAEHDADAVWWADTCHLTRRVAERLPRDYRVDAIGLSSCGPCVVPVDADGRPLRAGILYGIDTRATHDVDQLAEQFPPDLATALFGMPFSSQSVEPKLRWIDRTEPEVSGAVSTWLTTNGYVASRLTDVRVVDHHQAAYFAPHYVGGRWSGERHHLPEIVWSDVALGGGLTPAAATLVGLPAGVPVVIGSSDGATDPVGAGLGVGSTALLRYGSTLGITILHSWADDANPGLWRTPGNRHGETMYVGGLSAAGSLTSWFREQFARELDQRDGEAIARAHGALLAEAAASPPGSGGVLSLPYFAGERTPFADPDARGVIVGLGLATTRGDLYRSLLEGSAFGLRHILEVAATGGTAVERLRTVGGGTAGGLWPQIVADVTGIPQEIVEPHLGAPLGAARLAAEGTGLIDSSDPPWVRVTRVIEPRAEFRDKYDRLYALFRRLYDDSRDVVHGLREWRG